MNWLASVDEARALTESQSQVRVLDCRAQLGVPGAGRAAWLEGHLPGAIHADLESELSTPGPPFLGRHPLPDDAQLSTTFSRWGLSEEHWLLAYDAGDGAYAARAWWLATRAGHTRTHVVDGGLAAWLRAGHPIETGERETTVQAINRAVSLDRSGLIDAAALTKALADASVVLLDARASPRFHGEVEPIDEIAGHVPGARNRPYANNLVDGRFKPAAQLREEFLSILEGAGASAVVHMCGSGVTALHNLLAMDEAGLLGSRLFSPSWSGWIANPENAIAFGGDSPMTPPL